MSVSAAQLSAKVVVEGADNAKSQLGDIGKSADGVSGGFGNMLKQGLANAAGFAIFNVGAKAIGFVKDQLADTITVAMRHQDVMAQTAQVIKSTGDASGMTAQSISDLAESLSKTTKFSEDTTEQGENLLLTFTGIGKDVFPAATKTMLDMSQAMGGDVKGAAIQLGKALNDPEKGFTALTRVGVTFTDEQKNQIKAMQDAGNTAGAQKIILGELQREFGGSAEAAGKTFGGQLQILKNNLEDVKQKIGTALLPILGQFTGWISGTALPLLDRFGGWFTGTAVPAMQNFGTVVGNIFTYVGNVLRTVPIADFQNAWKSVSGEVEYVAGKFGELIGSLNPLSPLLKQVTTDFDPVADIIQNLAKGALSVVTNLFRGTATALAEMTNAVQNGKGPYADFFAALSNIGNLLKGEFGKELKDLGQDAQQVGHWFMTSVVPAIKDALPGFENLGNTILTTVVPAVIQIRGVFVDVIQHAFEKFAPILEKIVPPLIRFAGILANDVANGLKFITPYVTQAAQAVGKFADEIMDRVAPIIDQWIKALTPLVEGFMIGWKAAWPQISAVLKGVWDEIVGIVKIAWALVSGVVKIGLDILGGNWKQAWTDFKDMLGGIWDGIKTFVKGGIEGLVGSMRPLLEAMSHIPGPAGDMAKSVLKSFGDMKDGATKNTDEMKTKVADNTVKMQIEAVKSTDKMRQGILAQIKDTTDPAKKHALEMKLGVVTHAEEMRIDAVNKAKAMKDGVTNHTNDMSKGVVTSTGQMRDGVKQNTDDMKARALDNTAKMHTESAEHFDKMRHDLISQIQNTSDPVKKHALEMKLGVVTHAEEMHVNAANAAKKMADEVVNHTKNMSDGAKNKLDAGASGIQSSMENPFVNALGTIGGVFSAIGKLIGDATTFNWGAIPGDLHALSIPGFAGGTNYAPGGMAIVGERGPEAVYLPRGSQVVPNNQLNSAGGIGGQPVIHVHNYIDGKEITNNTGQRLIKTTRTSGPIRSNLT